MKRILYSLTIVYSLGLLLMPNIQAQEDKKIEKKVKIVTVDENGKKVVIDTVLTGDMDLEDLDLPEGIKIHKKDNYRLYITDDDAKSIYVTVDEKGDISTEEDEDIFHIKKGNVMILKKGEGDVFTIHETIDGDKDVHKVIAYTICDGDTIKKEVRAYEGKHKNIAWVSAGGDEDIHIHEGNIFIKKGDKDSVTIMIKVDESGKEKVKTLEIMKDDLEDDEKEIIILSAEGEEHIKIKGDAIIKIVDGKVKVEAGEASKELEKKIVKKKQK